MWTHRWSRSAASGLFLVLAAQAQVPVQIPAESKIRFDVSGFTVDGLYGPADGLRSLAYEFCIPASAELVEEVRAIDPTVEVYAGSPGRIGCTSDEYLCIGSTYQPHFLDVLRNMAGLEYVTRIEPSFGE